MEKQQDSRIGVEKMTAGVAEVAQGSWPASPMQREAYDLAEANTAARENAEELVLHYFEALGEVALSGIPLHELSGTLHEHHPEVDRGDLRDAALRLAERGTRLYRERGSLTVRLRHSQDPAAH